MPFSWVCPPPGGVVKIRPWIGDSHAQGRTVALDNPGEGFWRSHLKQRNKIRKKRIQVDLGLPSCSEL